MTEEEEYSEQTKAGKGRHGGRRPNSGRKVGPRGWALHHYYPADVIELARNCLMLEQGRDVTDNELRQFIRSAANEGVQAATKRMQDALAERGVIVTAGAIII